MIAVADDESIVPASELLADEINPLVSNFPSMYISSVSIFTRKLSMYYKNNLLKYLLFITITLIAINQHLLFANWRWDDTQILLHALNTSAWDNFTNPDVWRKFSPNNLTPWLILSFEIDYILFGLNPLGFYFHHLLSLIILSFLFVYLAIKLTKENTSGVIFLIIFLSGAPIYTLTEQLMTRHYIEGMIFCILSIIFCLKYSDSKIYKYLVLSLMFYSFAAISKEIYVPLIGLLLLIYFYRGALNYKIVFLHFIIGLAYAAWRFFMLPSVFGGYSTINSDGSNIEFDRYFSGYLKIPELIFGTYWIFPSIAIIFLTIFYFYKNPRNIIFGLLSLAFILLPLAPLIKYPGIKYPDRYLFAIWAFASLFLSIAIFNLFKLHNNYINKTILTIFLFLTLPLAANESHKFRGYAISMGDEFDIHAKFIKDKNHEINFYPSKLVLDSGWFITGLFDLKKKILGVENKIKVITDEIYIKDVDSNFWIYNQECKCIEDKTHDLENVKKILTKSILMDAPLSVSLKIKRQPDQIEWIFGPYTEGAYEVLLPESNGAMQFQKVGSLKIQLDTKKDIGIIVKYTDPTGWSTYSPSLKVGIFTPTVDWKR